MAAKRIQAGTSRRLAVGVGLIALAGTSLGTAALDLLAEAVRRATADTLG